MSTKKWQKQRDRARDVLSREVGFVQKPHGGRLRVALAFPNTYFVGMSSLGFQTDLPPLQRHRRRRVRAGVPAAQAGAAGAARLRRAAADARVADAGPRVRRVRVLGLVRVGLRQRGDHAPAGRHGSASRGARSPRSARGDRRRGDVRQPRAAGTVRRRDRRRRRREPDSGSGGCAAADTRSTGSAVRTGDPARLLHPRALRRALSQTTARSRRSSRSPAPTRLRR